MNGKGGQIMKSLFRYLAAFLLIFSGIMLVLTNIGLVDFQFDTAWGYIYPVFFVGLGLVNIVDYITRRGGSWIWGSFFIIFGSLLLMDRFEMVAFGFWDVFKLWPLLIVYLGFSIFGKNKFQVIYDSKDHNWSYDDSGSSYSFGDHTFNQPNWKVEPINLKTMAGDFYFDFSKAFIPEKEIPIAISTLAGDVSILVPENIDFQVRASVVAGEINVLEQRSDGVRRSLSYKTPDYDEAVQKLDIMIRVKAGSVRVSQV